MSSVIIQIAVYTRLYKEYSELPCNTVTPEEFEPIERKRQALKQKIAPVRISMDK